eukprot:2050345-Pleurochrysis_carterae.AAC.1
MLLQEQIVFGLLQKGEFVRTASFNCTTPCQQDYAHQEDPGEEVEAESPDPTVDPHAHQQPHSVRASCPFISRRAALTVPIRSLGHCAFIYQASDLLVVGPLNSFLRPSSCRPLQWKRQPGVLCGLSYEAALSCEFQQYLSSSDCCGRGQCSVQRKEAALAPHQDRLVSYCLLSHPARGLEPRWHTAFTFGSVNRIYGDVRCGGEKDIKSAQTAD